MRKPLILPTLFLVLFGVFACFLYTAQWPKWALRLQIMPEQEYTTDIAGGDFRLFWAQGRLASKGEPLSAYNASEITEQALLQNLKGVADIRPSFYPPHFILMMQPLGELDYPRAWHLYNWGSVLFLAFVTVFAFRREYYALPLLAGFGGLWCALSFGQNSIFLTALYLIVTAWGVRRETAGGLALAVASFKPHLGVLAPLMLLWRAQYITIFWATVGVALLVGLSVLAYGEAVWLRYFEVIQEPVNRLMDFKNVQGMHMISLYATLRQWSVDPHYALAAQAVLALIAVHMLWRICRRALDPMLPGAALVTASLLAMPHAYSYDLVLLFIPFMVIVRRAQQNGWQWQDFEVLLPAYAIPYYVSYVNKTTMLPVVPVILLLLLCRLKQHSRMDHA